LIARELGYIKRKDEDGLRWETANEYLNRISGLVRLYCRLLVLEGPPFDNDCDSLWAWFAETLNLPARENITVLLLRVLLEEAGRKMLQYYNKQFVKLMVKIESKLAEFKSISSPDQMERLQHILDALKRHT
jgi:hypothetical protein